MAENKPSVRRMTLRELLINTEKTARDLASQINIGLLTQLNDYRELTRPVRKRSSFPSVLALMNALQHLQESEEELDASTAYLLEQLEEIREHALKEKMNR